MNLNQLRTKLDQIDNQILTLLSERQQVVKKVAQLKQNHQKIHQPERESELIDQKFKQAAKLNLNPMFITKIFELILTESKKLQHSLIK